MTKFDLGDVFRASGKYPTEGGLQTLTGNIGNLDRFIIPDEVVDSATWQGLSGTTFAYDDPAIREAALNALLGNNERQFAYIADLLSSGRNGLHPDEVCLALT